MLQVGSIVRVKENAYRFSDEIRDIEVRGKAGEIVAFLGSDSWEVKIGDEWYILNSDELEEIEIEENIDPDTPRNREVLAAIRQGIALLGWEEYEKQLVEALELHLVSETEEKRSYANAGGEIKIIFTSSRIEDLDG